MLDGRKVAEPPIPALIVEMDPFFAILVRRAMEASGIACRVAYSARAAAQLAETERFQLAFVGVRLPDDVGMNLIGKIRAGQNREIPIILVGTDDAPEFRRQVLAAGANEYVLKPLTVADLRELAKKWTGLE